MPTRAGDRLLAATGLTAVAAVGAATALEPWAGAPWALGPWWAAYALFTAAFVADDAAGRLPAPARARRPSARALLAVQVAAALAAWSLAPAAGWTAVLFVVTAVSAAYALGPTGTAVLVAAQCAAVVAGTALAHGEAGRAAVVGLVYGAFQVFAVLVVLAGRREAEQRAALAAAHAELRAAAALLATSARDAERLRISRDLHDVVGHGLTALALELEVASHRVDGPAGEHVERARSIAKDLLADVRRAVGGLRGQVRGLEAALREAAGDPPGLEVDLAVREEVPLDPERALVVVRCTQELVTNALRHAGARRLRVDVVAGAAGVHLVAEDDGRGSGRLRLGNGLNGVVERVEDAGGSVRFRTAPGRGFRAEVRVPA
ncbi:sensor histidine kinase [Kineococcus gypseus]|uniref:sensor histidine kinase n=1 Tax=Kineococcus gypseus TaxID=1637102 RepID=UPI003D7D2941